MKSGPGRQVHERKAGKRNPAGAKIARKCIERTGQEYKGEVFHGGELTKANNMRRLRRVVKSASPAEMIAFAEAAQAA